jgi:hypothetical protein
MFGDIPPGVMVAEDCLDRLGDKLKEADLELGTVGLVP